LLLVGFSSGAAQDMGSKYPLASIAAVMIGGILVTGGKSDPPFARAANCPQ